MEEGCGRGTGLPLVLLATPLMLPLTCLLGHRHRSRGISSSLKESNNKHNEIKSKLSRLSQLRCSVTVTVTILLRYFLM